MIITEAEVAGFVRNSANQLDQDQPNWQNQIDLKRLNMNLDDKCIAGQLGLRDSNPDKQISWAASLSAMDNIAYSMTRGFYIPDCVTVQNWDDEQTPVLLKNLWQLEIESRLCTNKSM